MDESSKSLMSSEPRLSIGPSLSSSESKASNSSAGSPGLLSLNAHIVQILASLSSFLWRPISMCSQWEPVRFPEVSVVQLLDVWFRGIAMFDVAVSFALGRGLLAQLLYMLKLR